MARLPRIAPAGIPVHVIQRGNNRQTCFKETEDFSAYAGWLKEYSQKHKVDIHAWVFMTNHVHLLCTPLEDGAVSMLMQSLGRRYVRYFNYRYQRTGTLWEGRFKSCLVQTELYLLQVYRYIELNPVRAGMAKDPGEYRWSSFQINALGKKSDLCTPHSEYLGLGGTKEEQLKNYRALFDNHLEDRLLKEIRVGTNKGLAIGHDRFKEQIEKSTGRKMKPGKVGRPVGWRKHGGSI